MNILFISHLNRDQQLYVDPSVRYRCFHLAEEFSARGLFVDVCRFRALSDIFIDRYDVFVFHKPKAGLKLSRFLRKIRHRHKLAVADYDDLIFDEAYAPYSPQYLNRRSSLKRVRQTHANYHDALRQFDCVTVATRPLYAHVKACHPAAAVKVVHNGLSTRWVNQGRFLFKKEETGKLIGYFPGTSSHNHDFPIVEKALKCFLDQHKDVRLMIMGPLNFDKSGYDSKQIVIKQPVRYGWLPYWIKQCWLTIAPLKKTHFNACKSGLKFFESAIWGVPVVATPIPDMQRFEDTDILLANRPEEWLDNFEALYGPDYYQGVSQKIQQYVNENCMVAFQVEDCLMFFQSQLNRKRPEMRHPL